MLAIREMLKIMVEKDAGDLYITRGIPPQLRVRGKLDPIGEEKLTPEQTRSLANELMADWQQKEFEETSEMNLAFEMEGIGRFRVNIFRQRGTVGMVIRQVKLTIPSLEELRMPLILQELIMRPRGLILVTGATGSGKSSTLAAMIDYRNSRMPGHIITLEDPIEFLHPHKKSVVTQREVGVDTHSFASGIRNMLRQAPTVILVGEIRDVETMEAAMSFAETGHLVLSTLHSINANQTIERIIQFFPADMDEKIYQKIALVLQAVISQRLIPTKDGSSWVPAAEIMISTARVRELISKGQIGDLKIAIEEGVQHGMQSFDQSLFDLYNQGLIDKEQALRAADSPGDLDLKMRGFTSGTVSLSGGGGATPKKTAPPGNQLKAKPSPPPNLRKSPPPGARPPQTNSNPRPNMPPPGIHKKPIG